MRRSQTIGGIGGDEFDDAVANRDLASIASLAIFAVNVPTADGPRPVIGKIRVQWEDGNASTHGLKASADEPILLSHGEVIKQIEINAMTYSYPGASPPPTWVSGITVTTNKRSLRFGNTNTSASTTCVPDDKERIAGFYGKSGDFVD